MRLHSELLDSSKRLLKERAPLAYDCLHAARVKRLARGRQLRVQYSKDRIAIVDRARKRQIWLSRANAIYTSDMAIFFEYYFNAVAPFQLPGGGDQVVDYSTPRFHKVTGFEDFPVLFPSLAEPYQTCEQYLDFARLQEGQTVFDLGCYSGLTAIAFSKAVGGTGRVISVEPDPRNFSACVENVNLHRRVNGLDTITLLPVAVSSTSGRLKFSAEGSMGSSAVSIVGAHRGAVIEIPCTTLDDLAKQSGVERVAFIKMDIEGSELEVIRNAGSFLRVHQSRLIIEPHIVNGALCTGELIALLTSYGYECNVIAQIGLSAPLLTATPA